MRVSYKEIKSAEWVGKNTVRIRLRSSFNFASSSQIAEMNQWCEENCQGYWYSGSTTFFSLFDFANPTDSVIFKLRWG